MITHVLDTSAILAHYLHEPGADQVNAILALGPEAAGISLIALVELRGRLGEIATSPQAAERAFLLYTQTLLSVLPFSCETAHAAIELRSAAHPRLPLVDALIAASAKEHGAVLVHRDPHMATIPMSLLSQSVLPPRR